MAQRRSLQTARGHSGALFDLAMLRSKGPVPQRKLPDAR
jgi:hypothetical protein